MVSLTRSYNTNSGGATFFSESVNMDDREHLQPILDAYGVFKPLQTAPLFGIHIIYTVILEVIAIVFAVLHPDESSKCREYFIIIYIHIGLWFLTWIINYITKLCHHGIRINGYFEFYHQTKLHVNLPLHVVSLWSVLILFTSALMQHFYPDDFAERCVKGGTLSPISYVCAFITIEFGLIFGINVNYIVKVRKFNLQKPPPDVQKSEEWTTSPDAGVENEVGFRQIGDHVFGLLEKQADLIWYLKQHNERLGEKLMILSAQLQQSRGANRNVTS